MQNKPTSNKPHVIKDYSALDTSMQEKIRMKYPDGLEKHMIRFTNKEGVYSKALPFETEDRKYLIRMTSSMAKDIERGKNISATFDKSLLDQDLNEGE
ncbi:hypothetical protein [Reichenbachiella versicolor]|uniref:hypothetical protein n=1 Tax=Reichenbachiella versicolor TaxID=1821036 RepID=UPI000D6E3654|nr:hypothetical protein [Reichenbachiella versicolor]